MVNGSANHIVLMPRRASGGLQGRRMVDRRNPRTYDQAAFSRAADRVVAKVEELATRVEDRLDRIERRQAQGDLDDKHRDTELNQVRIELGELRDAVRLGSKGTVAAVVKGFWSTRLGQIVVIATGVTALITAGEKIPKAARAIDDGWRYVVEQGRNDEQ